MNYMKRYQNLMRPVASIMFVLAALTLFSPANLFSKTLINRDGKDLILYSTEDNYFPVGPSSIGNLEMGMTKQKIESFGKESPIFTSQKLVCKEGDGILDFEICSADFTIPFSTVRSKVTFRFDESGKVTSLYMRLGEDKDLYKKILRAVTNKYGSPARIRNNVVEKTCDYKSGVKIKSDDGFRVNAWHKKENSEFISFGANEYYSIHCSMFTAKNTNISESYGLSLDLLPVVSVEAQEEAELIEHLF